MVRGIAEADRQRIFEAFHQGLREEKERVERPGRGVGVVHRAAIDRAARFSLSTEFRARRGL